nr:putative ribonuclease H-like domain-containing protein [Tanacetum cinerariifolium]
MFNEYVNGENEVVSESSTVSNKQQHTTQSTLTTVDAESPHLIIHATSDPSTLTSHVNVEDNQNDQENDTQFDVKTKPKNIKEAVDDHAWIEAMQEELHQFERINVWELVDKPFGKYVKCKYVTRNTGKGRKNEENTDSYEALRHNPYDSVTSNIFK